NGAAALVADSMMLEIAVSAAAKSPVIGVIRPYRKGAPDTSSAGDRNPVPRRGWLAPRGGPFQESPGARGPEPARPGPSRGRPNAARSAAGPRFGKKEETG